MAKTLKPFIVTDPTEAAKDPLILAVQALGAEVMLLDAFEDVETHDKVQRITNPATGLQLFMDPVPVNEWGLEAYMEAEVRKRNVLELLRVYRQSTYEVASACYRHTYPAAQVDGATDTERAWLRVVAAEGGFCLFRIEWAEGGRFRMGHPLDADFAGFPLTTAFVMESDDGGTKTKIMALVEGDEFALRVVALERKVLSGLVLTWEEALKRARVRRNEPAETFMTEDGEIHESPVISTALMIDANRNEDFPDGWAH